MDSSSFEGPFKFESKEKQLRRRRERERACRASEKGAERLDRARIKLKSKEHRL